MRVVADVLQHAKRRTETERLIERGRIGMTEQGSGDRSRNGMSIVEAHDTDGGFLETGLTHLNGTVRAVIQLNAQIR